MEDVRTAPPAQPSERTDMFLSFGPNSCQIKSRNQTQNVKQTITHTHTHKTKISPILKSLCGWKVQKSHTNTQRRPQGAWSTELLAAW